jgi:hypothetical protein
MENKQTAVEWLTNQIYEHCRFGGNFMDVVHITQFSLDELIKQAKQMEKEQIMEAATWGYNSRSGEQYYNKTYNK